MTAPGVMLRNHPSGDLAASGSAPSRERSEHHPLLRVLKTLLFRKPPMPGVKDARLLAYAKSVTR